jgi:hypothetical protein
MGDGSPEVQICESSIEIFAGVPITTGSSEDLFVVPKQTSLGAGSRGCLAIEILAGLFRRALSASLSGRFIVREFRSSIRLPGDAACLRSRLLTQHASH